MANPVVHFEIGCRDREQTARFYSKLFDWQIASAGPASMIAASEGASRDVQGYLDKAGALGAKTRAIRGLRTEVRLTEEMACLWPAR
jgi:predicted enzyme related to lactoylglutathione lyase